MSAGRVRLSEGSNPVEQHIGDVISGFEMSAQKSKRLPLGSQCIDLESWSKPYSFFINSISLGFALCQGSERLGLPPTTLKRINVTSVTPKTVGTP